MTEKAARIIHFRRDPAHPPTLTPAQKKRLGTLPIDYSDIPELPDEFWTRQDPTPRRTKRQITLRLDPEIVEFFRAQGRGYQGRMNTVLRTYVEAIRAQADKHGKSGKAKR